MTALTFTDHSDMPEPGLWGVVEAGDLVRDKWVHYRTHASVGQDEWFNTDTAWTARWCDLIDPTLIREGVEP